MITIDDLSLWIKENTALSDSSIYKYSRAVNTISNEMQQKGIIPVGLFDMSVLQCDFYLPIILRDPDFISKNSTGNNMYSNALKQYRMFRTATSDMIINQSEVEDAILGYENLNETERTAIVKSRVGQGLFRKKLLEKYNSTCIITGVSVKRLLIASHIKPWAVSDNEERLSDENGLLLSPTYDKLFDYGLITFTNLGKIIVSSQLSVEDRTKLHLSTDSTCIITGVSVKRLLIASHIKPWAVSDNEERLSDENGLLLSPTYDKLFDYGLITFTNLGKIIVSSQLSVEDRTKLHLSTDREYELKMTSKMKEHLDYHRDIIFVRK